MVATATVGEQNDLVFITRRGEQHRERLGTDPRVVARQHDQIGMARDGERSTDAGERSTARWIGILDGRIGRRRVGGARCHAPPAPRSFPIGRPVSWGSDAL